MLAPRMRMNRGITGCSREALSLLEDCMLMCSRISIFLRQSEVDHVDHVRFAHSNHEVIRFQVAVDEVSWGFKCKVSSEGLSRMSGFFLVVGSH
jgi:hypothetical protein